jgi:hypothetical protein
MLPGSSVDVRHITHYGAFYQLEDITRVLYYYEQHLDGVEDGLASHEILTGRKAVSIKSLIIIRLNYYLTSLLTKIVPVTRTSQATNWVI